MCAVVWEDGYTAWMIGWLLWLCARWGFGGRFSIVGEVVVGYVCTGILG